MDDATLVEAARSGDVDAWAAIYDRYADKLHDHCHRLLRDREEAADALHDAFIAASKHIDQLRDPSRLRPWLYSICRNESLRRVRQRQRVELTDEVDDMSGVEVDLDHGTRAGELQELVWSAAAGLNERDQALLDLNLRQGLEGQDLADAMGTSLNSSYVLMSRLRDQVERSLGALLIARLGRDDCEELDALLQGWDGRFTPLLRKRVARHVDGCDVCSERRATVLSPMALLAAAPLVPAPTDLRSRVLEGIGGGGSAAPVSFTPGGFAAPSAGPGRRSRRLLGAAAAVLLLVVGVAVWAQDDEPTHLLASGDVAPAVEEDPTSTTSDDGVTSTSGPDGSTSTSPETSTTAPELANPPGPGGETPPATRPPTIAAPPVTPAPDTVAPTVGALQSSETVLATTACNPDTARTTTISTTITDTSTVNAVLRWTGDPGSGQVTMTRAGNVHSATFGGFTGVGGTVTYSVGATDAAGNVTTRSGTIEVLPCPL